MTDLYDAIILGAGLGGLASGAILSRRGMRVLVIEQHVIAGGYATSFTRKREEVEVSLHALGDLGPGGRLQHILDACGVNRDKLRFATPTTLYRAEFPDYRISVPQYDSTGYIQTLQRDFGVQSGDIRRLVNVLQGIRDDILTLIDRKSQGASENSLQGLSTINAYESATLEDLFEECNVHPRLRAVFAQLWGYFGLPPSRLSLINFAYPWTEYHLFGSHYPISRSQSLSNALSDQIKECGGDILLRTRVRRVLCDQNRAFGVELVDGSAILGKKIISNVNPYTLFNDFIGHDKLPARYMRRIQGGVPSLSCIQLYLIMRGSFNETMRETEHEVFINESYDIDQDYHNIRTNNIVESPFVVTCFNNIFDGYSSPQTSIVSAFQLSNYENWAHYDKKAYRNEKRRVTAVLLERLEKRYPGITRMTSWSELSTPMTNLRYTGNPSGAIYGWEPTPSQSTLRRLPQRTPIENLYLVGAWTQPGGGYSGALWSAYLLTSQIEMKVPA